MRILKFFSFFVLAFFLISCGASRVKKPVYRIGIDPNWYPLNFEASQPYVNGFTEDLLLEISRYTGIEWLKMEANWDSLLQGLQEKRYDAILTPLAGHDYNRAKYDFSKNFLDLGPVLIVPVNAKSNDLSKLSNEVVGVVMGDPAFLLLQKYPEIIVRKYETVTDLLSAVATGSLEGALLDSLVASSYLRDLYGEQLKIATEPLTDAGLRLVCLKGRQKHLVELFNQTLHQLKKQKKIQALQQKWQLYSQAS